MTRSKKLMIGGIVVLLLLGTLSAVLNKKYDIQYVATLNAPVNVVYNALNDLKHQSRWNSKARLDTSFQLLCAGSSTQTGASCDYSSKIYGNGILRILSANNKDSIVIADEIVDGKDKTFGYYLAGKDSLTTTVTVRATGHAGFISNLWNYIHKWKLKKQTQHNVENLHAFVTERYKDKIYNGFKISEIALNQRFFITSRSEVAIENIQQYYSQNISGLYQKALDNKIVVTGMPCALFYKWDENTKKSDMAAALPTLAEMDVPGSEAVNIMPKLALKIEYKGEHSKTGIAHMAMDEYMLDHRLRNDIPVIEEYMTDPAKEPDPSLWVTNIYYYISPR